VAEQANDHCPRQRTVLGEGPMVVVDPESNRFPTERETIALCRCGGSTTKPFCDGTHSKVGCRAAKRAVREEVWQER
jgi:CDGSH-type Zn-finger protein